MNVEIGNEATQFPQKEDINGIFVEVLSSGFLAFFLSGVFQTFLKISSLFLPIGWRIVQIFRNDRGK
jgi:hypothetical protein